MNETQMTTEEKVREMVKANPNVLSMIEELDLVNPETGLRFCLNPEEQRPISETDKQKLSSIAQRIFNEGRIYTQEQILSLLESQLRITRQRAVNGFRMMLTSGVLTMNTGRGIRLSGVN